MAERIPATEPPHIEVNAFGPKECTVTAIFIVHRGDAKRLEEELKKLVAVKEKEP